MCHEKGWWFGVHNNHRSIQAMHVKTLKPEKTKKKHRTGKQVRINREKAELRKVIPISSGKQKQEFFLRLRALDDNYGSKTATKLNETYVNTPDENVTIIVFVLLALVFYIIIK